MDDGIPAGALLPFRDLAAHLNRRSAAELAKADRLHRDLDFARHQLTHAVERHRLLAEVRQLQHQLGEAA